MKKTTGGDRHLFYEESHMLSQGFPPTIGGVTALVCPGPAVTRGVEAPERAGRSHNGWDALLAFLCLADSLPPPSKLSPKVTPSGKAPPASLPCQVLQPLLYAPQAPGLRGPENGIRGLTITPLSTDNIRKRRPEKQPGASWKRQSRRERRKRLGLDRGQGNTCTEAERNKQGSRVIPGTRDWGAAPVDRFSLNYAELTTSHISLCKYLIYIHIHTYKYIYI